MEPRQPPGLRSLLTAFLRGPHLPLCHARPAVRSAALPVTRGLLWTGEVSALQLLCPVQYSTTGLMWPLKLKFSRIKTKLKSLAPWLRWPHSKCLIPTLAHRTRGHRACPSFLKALLNSSGLEGEATPHGGPHSLWGSGAFYLTVKFLLVFLLVLASFLLQNQVKKGASGFDVRLLGNYGLTETRRPTSLSSQLIRRLLPFG